jgi:hypothetical protein
LEEDKLLAASKKMRAKINTVGINFLAVLQASLVLCTFCSSPASAAEPAAATNAGWTMRQNSQIVGDFDVYITARGVKASNRKHAISMLCVSPYKEIVLYCERTKKYFPAAYNTFTCPINRTLAVVNSGLLSDTPMVKKESTTYQKLPVQSYICTLAFTNRQLARYRANDLPGRAPRDVTTFTTEALKIDPRISWALNRFYGLPRLSGFALYSEFNDLGGDKNESLTTQKISKANLPDSTMALPPNLNRAAKHEELFVSEDTADEMGLMMLGH